MKSKTFFIYRDGSGDKTSCYREFSDEYGLDQSNQYISMPLVEKMLKDSSYAPCYRIFELHSDESIKCEIPQGDIQLGGNYQENYQSGERRNVNFTLLNNDGKYTPNVDTLWANTKIKLEVGLRNVYGDEAIWFSNGIYAIQQPSPNENDKTVSVSARDKFSILTGPLGVIPETYEIDIGTPIKDIVEDILTMQDGAGNMLDPKPIIWPLIAKDKKTEAKLSGNAGDTYGNLILQIAEMINCEVFYNAEGNLTFVPIVEVIKDGDKPVLYNYVDTENNISAISYSYDFNSIVNAVCVYGATVNGHTCLAKAYNDNPNSPINSKRIGVRWAAPINDSNITADFLAEERAEYELRLKTILKTNFTIAEKFNPLLSVNNLVTITNPFFDMEKDRFVIQSLQYGLDYSGTVNITASNINNLKNTYGGA